MLDERSLKVPLLGAIDHRSRFCCAGVRAERPDCSGLLRMISKARSHGEIAEMLAIDKNLKHLP